MNFFMYIVKGAIRYLASKYNKLYFLDCKCNYSTLVVGPDYPFDFFVKHPKNIEFGNNCVINGSLYLDGSGGFTFGECCHLAKGLTVLSSNHNWHSNEYLPYYGEDKYKEVIIGDAVWIGANVTLLPGVTIGSGAIVAAGSVVKGSIEGGAIYGGNPAKLITVRNQVDFDRLLKYRKFV